MTHATVPFEDSISMITEHTDTIITIKISGESNKASSFLSRLAALIKEYEDSDDEDSDDDDDEPIRKRVRR